MANKLDVIGERVRACDARSYDTTSFMTEVSKEFKPDEYTELTLFLLGFFWDVKQLVRERGESNA